MIIENEQSLISKKKATNAFSVNRKYINSKLFRDKFEQLPLSQETKGQVYKEVGALLDFVDGQENEYMVALDLYDGHRITDNFSRKGESRRTGFTASEYKKITNADTDIIVVHNHSYNGRPSAMDMITFHNDDRIRLSIVACHNGDLYAIFKVTDNMLVIYEEILDAQKKIVSDTELAKKLATTKMYSINKNKQQKEIV